MSPFKDILHKHKIQEIPSLSSGEWVFVPMKIIIVYSLMENRVFSYPLLSLSIISKVTQHVDNYNDSENPRVQGTQIPRYGTASKEWAGDFGSLFGSHALLILLVSFHFSSLSSHPKTKTKLKKLLTSPRRSAFLLQQTMFNLCILVFNLLYCNISRVYIAFQSNISFKHDGMNGFGRYILVLFCISIKKSIL